VHLGQCQLPYAFICTITMYLQKDSGIPYRESEKQARRTAIHQSSANLHVERSTDRSTDTNKLNVARLELAMGRITDRLHGSRHRAATVLREVMALRFDLSTFFVVVRASIFDTG
jgi:hypothetical protein